MSIASHLLPEFVAFLFGLLIGSFLNVCVFRLPRDLSVLNPARSFCPGCERTIPWFDNIPLVSYALLRGRCRFCKEWIPLRYPLVELATGAMFALCVALFGLTPLALKFAIYSAIMIDLIATDMEERILPDEFTLGGTIVGIILAVFVPMPVEFAHLLLPLAGIHLGPRWISLTESVVAAGIAMSTLWFVRWIYEKIRHREGLGLGDVKMIAMIGSFLGFEAALVSLMVASILGAVLGLAYILIRKENASTYELPFGCFLGISGLAIAFYVELVVNRRFGH